jgi:hypothetical protein
MSAPAGYISEDEQATRLNVTTRTLRRWRSAGYGPRCTQVGRFFYYSEDAGPDWLKSCEKSVELAEPRRRRAA